VTDSDHADAGRSARPRFAGAGRRHVVAVAGIALLTSLLGLYKDAVFLSRFGIDSLDYLGRADIARSTFDVVPMLADVRFLRAFAVAIGALMLVLVLLYGLRIGIAAVRHATSMGRPYVPVSDAIRETLARHRSDQHSLGADLCRYLIGPYRLGVVLSVAALVAVNISASAEQDDVELVASVLRASPSQTDAASVRRAVLSDHRVVSVRTHDPLARFDNLIALGSSQDHLFYYDAVAQEPVVLAKSNVAEMLANIPVDQAAWFDLAGRNAAGSADNGGAIDLSDAKEGLEDALASTPTPSAPDRALPSVGGVGTEGVERTTGRVDAVAWNDGPSPAGETEGTNAGAKGQEPTDAAPGGSEAAAVRTNLEHSRDSLERLKEHVSALQGRVGQARSLIGRLELTLSHLDRLVADLADETGAAGRPRGSQSGVSAGVEPASYRDCREVELARPIRFGPERTSLDVEAIGVLFAAREQLAAAARAPDRQARLVIEGHDDTAGSTAHNLALSRQRAQAVRDFLRSELGVPEEALDLVALGGTGPDARMVRIYDCHDRPQPTASTASANVAALGPTRTAAASEIAARVGRAREQRRGRGA